MKVLKKHLNQYQLELSRVLSACSKASSMRTYVGMLKSKYQVRHSINQTHRIFNVVYLEMGDKQLKENYITKTKERNQSITNNNFNVSNMVVGPMIVSS